MNIVFVAHSPFQETFMVGSNHLAREMAALGHGVWHVGPPVTPFHILRCKCRTVRARLRRAMDSPMMRDGFTAMDPFSLVPWQIARHFIRRGNMFTGTSNAVRLLRRHFAAGEIDLLIMDDPRSVGLTRRLKPKMMLYRPTDFYAEMKADPTIIEAERGVLTRAAGVVSTSLPVLRHVLSLRPGLPSLVLENGVDHAHFSTPQPEPEGLEGIPHPRAVYVGALDFRFDHLLVDKLARRFPAVHFILIGDGFGYPRIAALGRPNIHLLGPRPYRELPGYLQHCDVGLIPLTCNNTNTGRSPMKLYEYGAAGLPVLARHTSELARRGENFVDLYSSEDSAVRWFEAILRRGRDREVISRHCESHTWRDKAETLLEFARSVAPLRKRQDSAFGPVLAGA